MLITESVPNRKVSVTMHFVKPFETRNINVFMLEPVDDSTKVTWDFDGTNVFLPKLMSVFVSTDRVMGKHFETGLEHLRTAAERSFRLVAFRPYKSETCQRRIASNPAGVLQSGVIGCDAVVSEAIRPLSSEGCNPCSRAFASPVFSS